MKTTSPYPGFLIVIEGIDGVGKTTQAQLVQEAMQARGLAVLRTKEPTTGQWGQVLRDSAVTGRLSLAEEVETFIKDRREHVDGKIMPALRDGTIVIVDRYYFSTAAYQGARGLDPQELIRRNEEFAPEPDLLVLLDLDVAEGLERIRTRGDRANLFEQTNSLQQAREIFLSIDKPYLVRIDARRPAEEVRDLILREFSQRYTEALTKSGFASKEQLSESLRLLGQL